MPGVPLRFLDPAAARLPHVHPPGQNPFAATASFPIPAARRAPRAFAPAGPALPAALDPVERLIAWDQMELDEAHALTAHLDEEAVWHADEEAANDDLDEWDDFGADHAEPPDAPNDARRRRAAAWRDATIEANHQEAPKCENFKRTPRVSEKNKRA